VNAIAQERLSTGVSGLDDVLGGGVPAGNIYWVEGRTGTGKTTLALQFVLEGARRGEPVLYVSMTEAPDELRAVASSHGWALDGVTLHEMAFEGAGGDEDYTVFYPEEVELGQTTRQIEELVERVRPTRVVLDAISELQLMARDDLTHRRQLLALRKAFRKRRCTVMVLDERLSEAPDMQLRSLAHGVIRLEQQALGYGGIRRTIRVVKLRGGSFRHGDQDLRIEEGGLVVYPRLVAAEHIRPSPDAPVSSGLSALDALLGGGLQRGDSTVIAGPAGAGKSTLSMQYAAAAAERGEPSVLYLFEESVRTFRCRADAMGIPLGRHIDSGLCRVEWVEPALITPGVFAHTVRCQVEAGARLVVLDSINGYVRSMPEEPFLDLHFRELLTYLGRSGVMALMTFAHPSGLGSDVPGSELSHLADVVIALRYFEAGGRVRQAVSVMKNRSASHERTIREFRLGLGGIEVGEPITDFSGVLSGVPQYVGTGKPLLGDVSKGVA